MLTAQHKQHVEKLLARLEEAEEEVRAKEKAEAALREEVQLVREQKDKNEVSCGESLCSDVMTNLDL